MGRATPHKQAVTHMSIGFLFLFAAFNTAQNLASTLISDNRLVNASSAMLYGTFTAAAVFAPRIVSMLSPRVAMFAGAVPYIVLVFSDSWPSYWLFIPVYAAVGFGASLLWTSQGIYLGRCAVHEAKATGESVDLVTSSFNGLFWTVFQGNGAVGLTIASLILIFAPSFDQAKQYIFLGFGALGAVGLVILFLLKPVAPTDGSGSHNSAGSDDEESGSSKPKPDTKSVSLISTLRLLASSRQMQLMLPIIIYNGASLGFHSSMFPLSWQDPSQEAIAAGANPAPNLWGAKYSGFVAAFFFLVNSVASHTWGKIIPRTGRRPLFVMAAAMKVVYFPLVISFARRATGLASGSAGAVFVIFIGAAVFGLGDSVLESQIPAILQSPSFFPAEADRDAAISNLRMWQSLGFALQFVIGILAPRDVFLQAVVLFPLMGVAMASLLWLDRRVRSIETSKTRSSGPASLDTDMGGAVFSRKGNDAEAAAETSALLVSAAPAGFDTL